MIVQIDDFGLATTKLGFLWLEPSVSINKTSGATIPSISLYADGQLRIKTYLTEEERNDAINSIRNKLMENNIACYLVPNTGIYINGFNILSVTKKFENRPNLPKLYHIIIEFTQSKEKVLSFISEKARDEAYEKILEIVGKADEGGNYDSLENKPSINGNVLSGDKTGKDLGLADMADSLKGYGITDAYTKTEVDSLITAINQFQIKVVEQLPEVGEPLIIYLIKKSETEDPQDYYEEYIWINDAWEHIGNTAIELTAENVTYVNGNISTVQEALDELLYVEPKVTSFSGGGTYEKGQVIESVSLKWTINKTIKTQSINNGIGELEASIRNYTVEGANLENDTTYTITVNDGKKSATANTSVLFRQKRYWGVSAETSLTNEQVLALSQEFATNRNQSRTFNCSGGKYFYFAIPKQFCSGISFKVGGLAFSAMELTEMELTNASGYVATYNIYRCSNLQTGSAISVEVL